MQLFTVWGGEDNLGIFCENFTCVGMWLVCSSRFDGLLAHSSTGSRYYTLRGWYLNSDTFGSVKNFWINKRLARSKSSASSVDWFFRIAFVPRVEQKKKIEQSNAPWAFVLREWLKNLLCHTYRCTPTGDKRYAEPSKFELLNFNCLYII